MAASSLSRIKDPNRPAEACRGDLDQKVRPQPVEADPDPAPTNPCAIDNNRATLIGWSA
jgi:hypothetical protein